MTLHMTIQRKLLASSLLSLAFVIAVGGIGFVAATRLASAAQNIADGGSALKSQMEADQAHDALRADVLAALLASETKDAAEERAIKADIGKHGSLFRDSLKALEAMPLEDSTRAAVGKVRPALIAYLDSANEVVNLAFTDRPGANARMPAFVAAFGSLEKEMEVLSDLIEDQANATQAASLTTASVAKATILTAIGLSIAVLLFVGRLVSRGIVRPIRRAVGIAETVAAGDLRSVIVVTGHDETAQLLAALKRMNESLVSVVATVRSSSENIATGSSEISTGNADLSQRTEEQASNLQQTAASMEEITATVRNNAETAQQATRVASAASEAAVQGGRVVGQVVSTMADINKTNHKIAEIITNIDGIAFQTNILALNAAVEAARAGEQGRGFAVVASEVRSLAQRSALAAKEIKTLIQSSGERVEAGSREAEDAGKTMQGIVAQVAHVTQLIGEISTATQEQSTGIGQIGDAVAQLDQVTQQNAALVEESAAAAESLSHQTRQLVQAVAVFQLA
ncbi:hypothetical protein BH11PSE9_BH11PSE9_27570 [soil metagenome]